MERIMEFSRNNLTQKLCQVTSLSIVIGMSISMDTLAVKFVDHKSKNDLPINLEFTKKEYIGQCPGIKINPRKIKVRFTSSTIQPAHNRRITITNTMPRIGNINFLLKAPSYIDRKYNNGVYSQDFEFVVNEGNGRNKLEIFDGENELKYEIYEGKKESKKVLESGAIKTQFVIKDLGSQDRSTIPVAREHCTTTWSPASSCDKDHKHTEEWKQTQNCTPYIDYVCPP
jgi:hypothetical protein